jgi:hypothetical protein
VREGAGDSSNSLLESAVAILKDIALIQNSYNSSIVLPQKQMWNGKDAFSEGINLQCRVLFCIYTCFFLSCKANARAQLAKTGHGPHLPINSLMLYLIFIVMHVQFCDCYICSVRYILCTVCMEMWAVLLPPGVNPIAVKYIYIYIYIYIYQHFKNSSWSPTTMKVQQIQQTSN